VRARIVVRGRVQGVAYRASTQRKARDLGLTGWVRNLEDGSVELEAQGTSSVLDALETWCRRGPALAKVIGLDRTDLSDVANEAGFGIR